MDKNCKKGRPPIIEGEIAKIRSIRFTDTHWNELKKLSKTSGVSIARYIVSLIHKNG